MRPGPRLRRTVARAALGLGIAYLSCVALAWARVAAASESASFVPMAPWGAGYRSYSMLGAALGRQYVRRRVRDALADAFEALDEGWVVAETGWRGGGPFWPHRTHRDGRAVDLLVPMRSGEGSPARLGSWPWQGFGYAHELDAEGRLGGLRFDAARTARLIRALRPRLRRVILDPELVRQVRDEDPRLPSSLFFGRRPWVRHDEHLHLDFR
ncbi:MAG: hypothetical protein AAGH15_15240 [Myxococcota bacterium]